MAVNTAITRSTVDVDPLLEVAEAKKQERRVGGPPKRQVVPRWEHLSEQRSTFTQALAYLSGESRLMLLPRAQCAYPDGATYSGALEMTSYQLRFVSDDEASATPDSFASIPLGAVAAVSSEGPRLTVVCKDVRTVVFTTSEREASEAHKLIRACAFASERFFCYSHRPPFASDSAWFAYDAASYYRDWLAAWVESKPKDPPPWRLSDANVSLGLCDSYPDFIIAPAAIGDGLLASAATFRAEGRLPTLTWASKHDAASIWRSSQPKVGVQGATNPSDEALVRAIATAGEPPHGCDILDARPKTSASANRLSGHGYESRDRYREAKIAFANIPNIHAMRDAHRHIASLAGAAPSKMFSKQLSDLEDEASNGDSSSLATASTDINWLSLVEDTKWLVAIRRLLAAAVEVTRKVHSSRSRVLVHCFPEDHQLLTNKGFVSLDDVHDDLLFASYDPTTRRLVYERGELVVNDHADNDLVEFRRGDVVVQATTEHDMYVRYRKQSDYRKVRAAELLDIDETVGFLSYASGGLKTNCYMDLSFNGPTTVLKVLELYGFWLCYATSSREATFPDDEDCEFVEDILEDCHIHYEYFVGNRFVISDMRWARLFDKWVWKKSKRERGEFDPATHWHEDFEPVTGDLTQQLYGRDGYSWWALALQRDQARTLLYGMRRAFSRYVRVMAASSASFRDAVVQLCLHAGWSPSVHRDLMSFSDIPDVAEPRFYGPRDIKKVRRAGRTWCVRLKHGFVVVRRALVRDGVVLYTSRPTIHGNCSHGWDRTSQVVALAQLLLDSSCRTIAGFARLVEKDFVAFGHPFALRAGHGLAKGDDRSKDEQMAPIFVQFLDAVHQLVRLFPAHFEFDSRLLLVLADQVYACRFDSFLFDTLDARRRNTAQRNTTSVWDYVLANASHLTSSLYAPETAELDPVLLPPPSYILRNVELWSDYHMRYATSPTTAFGLYQRTAPDADLGDVEDDATCDAVSDPDLRLPVVPYTDALWDQHLRRAQREAATWQRAFRAQPCSRSCYRRSRQGFRRSRRPLPALQHAC